MTLMINEDFYDILQSGIQSYTERDIAILMGSSFAEKQNKDFQYNLPRLFLLREQTRRTSEYPKEDADLCQQLSKMNPRCLVA